MPFVTKLVRFSVVPAGQKEIALVTVVVAAVTAFTSIATVKVGVMSVVSAAGETNAVLVTKLPAVCVTKVLTVKVKLVVGGKVMICTPASKLATLRVAGQTANGGPADGAQVTLSLLKPAAAGSRTTE